MSDTVIGLLVVWGIHLFGGFILGKPDPKTGTRMPLWTKLVSSFVLVVTAWTIWFAQPGAYTLLVAIGMTLGFIGDLFMADLFGWPNPAEFGGMAAFGLGHIAYISAVLTFGAGLPWGGRVLTWIMWLLIGTAGWYIAVWRTAETPSGLHFAALPYGLLLASTSGAANGIAWSTSAFWLFTVGAFIFLVSDLLIAIGLFNNKRFPLMGDLIWLTYGPGQAMIVLTALFI